MGSCHCNECGRPLSDPVSIQRGIGPICFGNSLYEPLEPGQLPLLPFSGDFVCVRTPEGARFNIPQIHVRHSPTGMEFGYGGSGPADFALNILCHFMTVEEAGEWGLYQEFKHEVVARIDQERGGVIRREDVLDWIEKKKIERNHNGA